MAAAVIQHQPKFVNRTDPLENRDQLGLGTFSGNSAYENFAALRRC
jgi:hypothetical protein